MIILRKAKLDDFETYKTLHQDEGDGRGYHWIYFSNKHKEADDNKEHQITAEEYFGKDFLKILEEEFYNDSVEKFEKDLKNNVILMAENDSIVVGYIKMFPCGSNTYKIAEWAMFDPDDENARTEILRELLKTKIPRLRKFSICVLNDDAKSLLEVNGFVASGATGFLSYEVVKKENAE